VSNTIELKHQRRCLKTVKWLVAWEKCVSEIVPVLYSWFYNNWTYFCTSKHTYIYTKHGQQQQSGFNMLENIFSSFARFQIMSDYVNEIVTKSVQVQIYHISDCYAFSTVCISQLCLVPCFFAKFLEKPVQQSNTVLSGIGLIQFA